MKSRGRKSAASLTVVPLGLDVRRPAPPDTLTEAQASIWRAVVADLPNGWINPGAEALLMAFCAHQDTAQRLSQRIDAMNFSRCDTRLLARLLAMRARETSMVIAMARQLRLTPQSRMHPRSAARRTDGQGSGVRPWELPDGEV